MIIPVPSSAEVEASLMKWESLENYVLQERSLKKLFTITYPVNTDIDEVLIKVCSLNDFYSTNIYSPFSVAKHIVSLAIDRRIRLDDLLVVNELAKVTMSTNKTWNFYSFASKYCSHHKPKVYPIYDSFVEKMLFHFRRRDYFYSFTRGDLKVYPKYVDVILRFIDFYKLSKYDLKEVDKYLWIKGKEYFQRIY